MAADSSGEARIEDDNAVLDLFNVEQEERQAAERENEQLREALERVRENAKSWHGPVDDHGHAKALAVIASWCDAALDARTEERTNA